MSPVCSAIFAGVGGFAGGAAGSLGGSVEGLPRLTTAQLNHVLIDLQKSRDFQGELAAALANAVPTEMQAEPGEGVSTAIARIDEIKLRQHGQERLSLSVWASMTQEWVEQDRHQTRTIRYAYTTPVADVQDWLLEDGKMFGESFTHGIDVFARWMAHDLDASSMRSAQLDPRESGTDRAHR